MSDEDNSLDKAFNGIGDEDNSKISLDEIIRYRSYMVGFGVTRLDYKELKAQAEARAEESGQKVVVVDLSDPNNLYTLGYFDREKELEQYEGKNVIFFHENLDNTCEKTNLYAASFHARCLRPGQENHIFITCLEGFEKNKNQVTDYYGGLWAGNYKSMSQILYLEDKLGELIGVVETALSSEGNHVINLIGKDGVGKTSTLHTLSSYLEEPFDDSVYISMDYYEGIEDEQEVFDDISIINPSEVLVLDDAEYVTHQLHEMLAERYKVIVYASPEPLEHEGIDRVVEL